MHTPNYAMEPPEYVPQPEDFIDLMPIVANGRWYVTTIHGLIRRNRVGTTEVECPMCALANEVRGNKTYSTWAGDAGLALGNEFAGWEVAGAADYRRHPLRAQLLAALGLEDRT